MGSLEEKQRSLLLKEEMKIALEDLGFQSSKERGALSHHGVEDSSAISDTLCIKIQASDPALNIHVASTSTAFFDVPLTDGDPAESSADDDEYFRNSNNHELIKNEADILKPNNVRHKTHFIGKHARDKLTLSCGMILVIFLLGWNGLIVWLIGSMRSYAHQTFGWKIILELLFMWINTTSKNCVFHTKEIILDFNERCVRREVYMNCPYEIEFSARLGIFLFLLAISSLSAILASLFLLSRKIRENCRLFGLYIIRYSVMMCCWISLWLLPYFIMSFYSAFSKLESEMTDSINDMNPPDFISLWWNQTQTYSQCCGMKNFEDWKTNNGAYPISCCNNIQRNCETLPNAEQVWLNGCYDEEYQRLQSFGGVFFTLWVLKIVGEFLLFCILCTAFGSYAIPDHRKPNSSVTINGYKIKTYGSMDINSMPNRHQVIIEMKCTTDDVNIKAKQRNRRVFTVIVEKKRKLNGYVKIIAFKNQSVQDVIVKDLIQNGDNNNCFLIEL